MQSSAGSVAEYLAGLPVDRREAINAVRQVIHDNLDRANIEEGMQYGMIGYFIPHRVYPAGYHCNPKEPLPFAGLASQKNHLSLYLMCVYGSEEESKQFQLKWAKTGKRLDMGKSCIRFKKVEDLALDVIAEVFRKMTAKRYITHYETHFHSGSTSKSTSTKKSGSSSRSAKKDLASDSKTIKSALKGKEAKTSASPQKNTKKAAKASRTSNKKK